MSTNVPRNPDDQEIDMTMVSQKFKGFVQSVNDLVFDSIQFLLRNKIYLIILVALGVGLGFYLDRTNKTYDHQIVVMPNFGSSDYLYAKVDLINAKIKERDTLFLSRIGIKNPAKFTKIEIKPIIDVYQFITMSNERNFELLKLMAEDSDIKKIIEERPTSKNYRFHLVEFKTKNYTTKAQTVEPLLNFLNNSQYFSQVQREAVNNIKVKMQANETIIAQIDGFLNGIANGGAKGDKLVYYNENSPLNDLIETKERIVRELGDQRINLITTQKIVRDVSQVLNIENSESVNGKLKFVLPLLLIAMFIVVNLFAKFYKTQSARRAQSAL